jgi:hypothetical protein
MAIPGAPFSQNSMASIIIEKAAADPKFHTAVMAAVTHYVGELLTLLLHADSCGSINM